MVDQIEASSEEMVKRSIVFLYTTLNLLSIKSGAIAERVKAFVCQVGGQGLIPTRAKFVEIYFLPFNTGDCVSLVAPMTT